MDADILGLSPIRHMEFENQGVESVPLPDQLPNPLKVGNLSPELLKSSTIESLISQNEDLMARLKVALRRLSAMELEQAKLTRMTEESQRKSTFAEDQLLVLKEKDKAWKARVREHEIEREVLAEKIRLFEEKIQTQSIELGRFRKYHEKVKTQIKPHLIQLKEYSRNLENQVHDLTSDIERKTTLLVEVRGQMSELTKNSRRQVELAESRVHELIESYENSIQKLSEEIQKLKTQNEELETQAARLRRAEQHCDELQNELIELRRSKESQHLRFESETRRLSEALETTTKENARHKIQNEDMRQKIQEDFEKTKDLQKQNLDLQAQLEGLRYLWTSRNDENEKLKMSLESLERLNVDLSSKIQEIRTSSPPPQDKV